jgi:hypothetical protein
VVAGVIERAGDRHRKSGEPDDEDPGLKGATTVHQVAMASNGGGETANETPVDVIERW